MDPRGRVALITGGARIGRTVAEDLARRGCHVALTYRASRASAEAAAAGVRQHGARALTIEADLSDARSPERIVESVRRELGGLDILICMASIYGRTPFEGLDEAAWRSSLDTDLRSVYLLALQAVPLMKARGAGRIITFVDWLPASRRPRYHGRLPYYVAKAGLVGLTESLALELAPTVLVNAIAPGPVLRPPGLGEEADREVIRATPLGRWGGAEEVARTVIFLIETEFITGECIRVDGGRHLS
ncbi:MAG: SDR family NAD(P)-dependent oxidoreductase [Acidobacteriota bacterium]